jgi:hypothetical protein
MSKGKKMLDQMTDRQKSFIASLVEEREVSPEIQEALNASAVSKREASRIIDTLLNAPRVGPVFRSRNPIVERLESLPLSKYAISMNEIAPVLSDGAIHGEYLFVEIRKYMERTYLRRLSGSPGDFMRSRMSNEDTLAVCDVLDSDPLTYIQTFGRIYTCCGKCGAPLTDDVSRARVLGPECARQLGVA